MQRILGAFLDEFKAQFLASEAEGLDTKQGASNFVRDFPLGVTENHIDADSLDSLNFV